MLARKKNPKRCGIQPVRQLGHCLASKFWAVTVNMLLH